METTNEFHDRKTLVRLMLASGTTLSDEFKNQYAEEIAQELKSMHGDSSHDEDTNFDQDLYSALSKILQNRMAV